tara:strand:+ start:347 stop:550 length:204 start_codon:yes stop_codon:yes gene_type:complete
MKLKKEWDITPNYQAVFELCKQLVRSEMDKENGQDLVLEMLGYGQRMDRQLAHNRKNVVVKYEEETP